MNRAPLSSASTAFFLTPDFFLADQPGNWYGNAGPPEPSFSQSIKMRFAESLIQLLVEIGDSLWRIGRWVKSSKKPGSRNS
jgi:hypothetical protein